MSNFFASFPPIGSGGGGGGGPFSDITGPAGDIAYFDATGHGTGDSLATRDATTKYTSIGAEIPAGGDDPTGAGQWEANNQGTSGNAVSLVFNGTTDTYASVTAAWNTAHSGNMITLTAGSGSFVPQAQTINFYGGGPASFFVGNIPFISNAGYGSGNIAVDGTSGNFAGTLSGNLGLGSLASALLAGDNATVGPINIIAVSSSGSFIHSTDDAGDYTANFFAGSGGFSFQYQDNFSDTTLLQLTASYATMQYTAGGGETGNCSISGGQAQLQWADSSGNLYGIQMQSGSLSISNVGITWLWPTFDDDGPMLSDGAGNLYFTNNFQFNNGTNPFLIVGDENGTGNGTLIDLSDSGSSIALVANGQISLQAASNGAPALIINSLSSNPQVFMGDTDSIFNLTQINLQDSAMSITNQAANNWYVTDISGNNFLAVAMNSGGPSVVAIGDVNTRNNGTNLTIDDGGQNIESRMNGSYQVENANTGALYLNIAANFPNVTMGWGDIQYLGNGTQGYLDDGAMTISLTANNGVTVYGNNLNVQGSIYLYSNGFYKGLGQSLAISTQSAAYTAGLTDYTILCKANAAPITITLPTGSQYIGIIYVIKKIDSSANVVTIASTVTIDGAAAQVLTTQNQFISVQYDGSVWWII